MNKKTSTQNSFEKSLSELEKIAESLAEGNLSLDESIKLFEKGIKLKDNCLSRLNKAEEKIKILIEKDGNIIEEDY